MTTYARIVGIYAIDVVEGDPAEFFHPALVPEFVEVPDGTRHGAQLIDGVWTNQAPATPEGKAK